MTRLRHALTIADRRDARRWLARKAQLTPGMTIAAPGSPFPWYQVPYLHGIMAPDSTYADGAVTTDSLGLRRVEIGHRLVGFSEFQRLPGPKKILLGASTAFSMGSSSDRATIASQLSRRSGDAWFNLAMGSYVSTQELVLFCLADPRDIDEVVVLSGLNTLTAAILNQGRAANDVFSPNFFSRAGAPPTIRAKAWRYAWRIASERLRPRRLTPWRAAIDAAHVQLALAILRRDLGLLRDVCQARRIRLTFFAQPLLSVLDKASCEQERELTEIQRALGRFREFSLWGLYTDGLPAWYPGYCQGIAGICRELGVDCYDMNTDAALRSPEWLFADQAHFTDRGAELCAARILDALRSTRRPLAPAEHEVA